MTRDDLVEWVARSLHVVGEYDDDCEFDASEPEHQAWLRAIARDVVSAVVEFVAEWLLKNIEGGAWPAQDAAAQWREEMGQ